MLRSRTDGEVLMPKTLTILLIPRAPKAGPIEVATMHQSKTIATPEYLNLKKANRPIGGAGPAKVFNVFSSVDITPNYKSYLPLAAGTRSLYR